MSSPSSSKGTESAGRVAEIVLQFANGPSLLGVSEIARALSISKAVVYRILQALVEKKLLSIDVPSRKYRLGPGLEGLGARALRSSNLRAAALPWLHRLQQETGETATVSALMQDSRIYIDQVESPQEIRMMVELGRLFPLHAGSSGNCMLAFLPLEDQERILKGEMEALTSRTIVNADEMRIILTRIRETGYAWSDGARQADAGSVAAPIFGFHGAVIGAVSVCGPVGRLDEAMRRKIGPVLVQYCAELSESMGWQRMAKDEIL